MWVTKYVQNLNDAYKNSLCYDQVVCVNVTESAVIYVLFRVMSLKFVKFFL